MISGQIPSFGRLKVDLGGPVFVSNFQPIIYLLSIMDLTPSSRDRAEIHHAGVQVTITWIQLSQHECSLIKVIPAFCSQTCNVLPRPEPAFPENPYLAVVLDKWPVPGSSLRQTSPSLPRAQPLHFLGQLSRQAQGLTLSALGRGGGRGRRGGVGDGKNGRDRGI